MSYLVAITVSSANEFAQDTEGIYPNATPSRFTTIIVDGEWIPVSDQVPPTCSIIAPPPSPQCIFLAAGIRRIYKPPPTPPMQNLLPVNPDTHIPEHVRETDWSKHDDISDLSPISLAGTANSSTGSYPKAHKVLFLRRVESNPKRHSTGPQGKAVR